MSKNIHCFLWYFYISFVVVFPTSSDAIYESIKSFIVDDICNVSFEDLAKWYVSVHFLDETVGSPIRQNQWKARFYALKIAHCNALKRAMFYEKKRVAR